MTSPRLYIIILSLALSLNCMSQIMDMKEINEFWSTIEENEDFLDSTDSKTRVNSIYESIKILQSGLYIECSDTKNDSGKYHVIISANGNLDLFELIDKIISRQPNLSKFEFTPLRQAIDSYYGISFKELNLKVAEMYFNPVELENGLGIEFYVPKQGSSISDDIINKYGPMVIDNLIGEREFATNIIAFDFYQLNGTENLKTLRPLKDLRQYLESRLRTK